MLVKAREKPFGLNFIAIMVMCSFAGTIWHLGCISQWREGINNFNILRYVLHYWNESFVNCVILMIF